MELQEFKPVVRRRGNVETVIDFDSISNTSSNNSEIPLFTRSKVHPGVGNSSRPIRIGKGVPISAGDPYFKTFENHLGAAASDPDNPLVKWFHNLFYKKAEDREGRLPPETVQKLIRDGAISKNEENKHTLYPVNTLLTAILDGRITQEQALKDYDLHKSIEYEKTTDKGHEGWLRNYPHMGPGNKIQGNAVNAIDQIARDHDIDYSNAKSKTNIYDADKQFINTMANAETKTWGDTAVKHLSKTGIYLKNTLEEKILDKVIYPSSINTDNGEYIYYRQY